ncbi:MAG: hypothetical protein IZT59_03770 [Verrucomicrobia bacterium]|jgi:hypothetical protein|nr:hypothetical protein [Verrucomicrobiota bacterium]|tara:strand:+ start:2199 stop:2951 length:753 start_codon:yes stop_codon:yes gene_type:complete
MHKICTLSLLLSLSTFLGAGETRTWTNADGTKHFKAELVSREENNVTLIREDGKKLTFNLEKLHENDRRWLNLKHPIGNGGEVMPDADAMFDTLKFGDSRETVSKKLKASKVVESGVPGVFLGRTGLNGIYRTKVSIGGLYCFLFFDWSQAGLLHEVTLQTENKTSGEYVGILKPCWEECIPLIISLHGNPKQKTGIPNANVLEDGQMLASHLWDLEHGGTVMLGTSRLGRGYQVVVRFTKDKIKVNRVP